MDDCQRGIPVKSGGTVLIEGWGLGYISANGSDFVELLAFFGIVAAGEISLEHIGQLPTTTLAMLERVIVSSLLDPADAARLRVADFGAFIEAIFEINALGDLIKKVSGLREQIRVNPQASLPEPLDSQTLPTLTSF